jgi:tryptophan 2,3-dioxygenase
MAVSHSRQFIRETMKIDHEFLEMPLYVEVIMNILRSMETFDYHAFRRKLNEESSSFNPSQKSMMKLRLSLLDACLKDGNSTNRISSQFKPGQLTIIESVKRIHIVLETR